MGDMSMTPPSLSETTSKVVSISTQIMIVAAIVLFVVIAFCFLLHLYVKCYWLTNNEDPNVVAWRRQLAGQRRGASVPANRRGLDPAALRSLPVVVYNPKDFKDGLECAVCLSEVSEGEKARLLPKCNHGFHVQCIDMWLQSHSTCPLCRDPVISSPNSSNDVEVQDDDGSYSSSSDSNSDSDDNSYASPRAMEAPVFPTNVLYWGNQTQVSSFAQAASAAAAASSSASSSGVSRPRDDEIVIEIPSHEFCEDCLSSEPSLEEAKTPVMTRLGSLRKLLTMGTRVAPSTSDFDKV